MLSFIYKLNSWSLQQQLSYHLRRYNNKQLALLVETTIESRMTNMISDISWQSLEECRAIGHLVLMCTIVHVLVDISLHFTPRAKWSPIKSYFWSVVSLTTIQYQLLPIFLFSTHNSSMELFTTNFALCILNPVI